MPLSHSKPSFAKLLVEFDPKPTLVVNEKAVAHLLAEMLQQQVEKSAYLAEYGIKVRVGHDDPLVAERVTG